ncbi:hypothetical protein [Tengunoibacter tsumagoiensis]|uniref:hypothetical protein n=1 Tax=Tengunoibacter tsumagoiensis TaxID=2014871 RepID=UPI000F81994A|nr:hypothetical protein [Tengunoibacter tsumagoiensis]
MQKQQKTQKFVLQQTEEGWTITKRPFDEHVEWPLRIIRVSGGYITVPQGKRLNDLASISTLLLRIKLAGLICGLLTGIATIIAALSGYEFWALLGSCFTAASAVYVGFMGPWSVRRQLRASRVLVVPKNLMARHVYRTCKDLDIELPIALFLYNPAASRRLVELYKREGFTAAVKNLLEDLIRSAPANGQ